MGITDEYRSQVESVQDSMENKIAGQDALSIKSALDDVLPFIVLLLAFVIMFSFVVPVSDRLSVWVKYANYLVIAYFATRLGVEFKLANSKNQFVSDHWLDMLMVVPAFSILQEAKIMKIVEETVLARYGSKMFTGSALQGTGIAARLTRISRMVKKSLRF
jgi:hypothetical protein